MIHEQVFNDDVDAGWYDAQDGIEPRFPDDDEYMSSYHRGAPKSRYSSILDDDNYDDWDIVSDRYDQPGMPQRRR